jgi:predicted metal-dependent hydrolase
VLTLVWEPGSRRVIQCEHDRLSASGPIETLNRRVETWLKRQALETLSRETAEIARTAASRYRGSASRIESALG